MKALLVAMLAVALVGCAKEQRDASLTVKEYSAVPVGATVIGFVDTSRCHRNSLDAPPDEAQLLSDLKAAAYARGADGIAGIEKTRASGLKNCGFIVTARAAAFTLKK